MDGAAGWSLHGSRDFHVRRTARERYGVDDALLGFRGDLAVADLAAIRVLAQRMNEARPPGAPGITAGEIGALGLLHEIGHLLVRRQGQPDMATAMRDVRRRLRDDLDRLLDRFAAAFPGVGPEPEPRVVQLEELLLTRVSNENPALGPLRELVDDRILAEGARYDEAIAGLEGIFGQGEPARRRRRDAGLARRAAAGAGATGAHIARRPIALHPRALGTPARRGP